jgi:ATP-dependent Clp protease ATP-binding subunit ClpA
MDMSGGEEKSVLEQYGVDLTARAKAGKLDPVIGRDSEIHRTIQVLSRRTKNNPVLIGSAGTGKTGKQALRAYFLLRTIHELRICWSYSGGNLKSPPVLHP